MAPVSAWIIFRDGGRWLHLATELRFVLTAENKLDFDGLVLTPESVGTVNLGFRWHPVIGYLGWGFWPEACLRSGLVSASRWAFFI